MLFRASRNGFAALKFHSKCDNKYPGPRGFSSFFFAKEINSKPRSGDNESRIKATRRERKTSGYLACVAWRFWLGARSNKGGRGQRNREEIGAEATWFLFFSRLRRSCARLNKTAMLRRLLVTLASNLTFMQTTAVKRICQTCQIANKKSDQWQLSKHVLISRYFFKWG